MSLRREAARTVFCFFFGGDKLATPSLAAGRATAFSGAAAATSLEAGTASAACRDTGGSAGGGETAAGLRCDPTEAARSADCRLLSGSAPSVPWERWRVPARRPARMSRWISGRALRRTLEAARLCRRNSRGWPRAHPHSGRCRVHCPGTRRHAELRRSPSLRGPNGEGRRHRIRKARPRCPRTAGRSPQCAARGVTAAWEKKARTRDADLNVPCAHLAKERDKNFQAAERFRRMKENDIPWRGVRRRPQKISPGEARDLEGTRRFLHGGNLTCPVVPCAARRHVRNWYRRPLRALRGLYARLCRLRAAIAVA